MDKNAIETHQQNFPECKLIGKDITKFKIENLKSIKENILYLEVSLSEFISWGK